MTKPDRRWTGLCAGLTLTLTLALELAAAASVAAQVPVGSLDELRRVLDPGDVISVVRTTGESVSGQLLRIGDTDLDLEIESRPPTGRGRRTSLTIPLTEIQSLDRPRDTARNGALIGAGIGAAVAGGLFVYALAIDRNEIDEWAPIYLGYGALFGGAGALVGWAIDSGRSKPHITFGTRPGTAIRVIVTPSLSRRVVGATVVASF
jgi:hypothetical protein